MSSDNHSSSLNNLPINRKSQFKYLLKYRWKSLLIMGGVLLLFAIPLFVSLLLKDLKAISIVSNSPDGDELTTLFINDIFYAVFVIPSTIIFFLGLAGIYRIIRNYIWGEGVIFGSDFFLGIKQNWKHFLINGLVSSTLFYGVYLATAYINVPFVKYLPLAFAILFIFPVILVHMNLTVIYKNNYFVQFKNAFVIYIRRFYIYFPLFLLAIIIPVIFMVFTIPLLVKYIILFVFIYLFIPFFVLLISVISIHEFDEMINKDRHPELYKKGLF